jgi:hypothetical protein
VYATAVISVAPRKKSKDAVFEVLVVLAVPERVRILPVGEKRTTDEKSAAADTANLQGSSKQATGGLNCTLGLLQRQVVRAVPNSPMLANIEHSLVGRVLRPSAAAKPPFSFPSDRTTTTACSTPSLATDYHILTTGNYRPRPTRKAENPDGALQAENAGAFWRLRMAEHALRRDVPFEPTRWKAWMRRPRGF